MPVAKGQKLKTFSFELKKKAIEMRLEGMGKKKVAEALGIIDVDRLKIWMRRYKQMGDFGLMESRRKKQQYVDQERYIKRLEMENAVLKKWLEITKMEVYRKSIASLTSCEDLSP